LFLSLKLIFLFFGLTNKKNYKFLLSNPLNFIKLILTFKIINLYILLKRINKYLLPFKISKLL